MRILITGSRGFIGKNLLIALSNIKDIEILEFTSSNDLKELEEMIKITDFIFHLAGTNRSKNEIDFIKGNSELTKSIADILIKTNNTCPIVFTSSIHAECDNLYGKTKKQSEDILLKLKLTNKNKVFIFRLPNVFGKWSLPNYNSVVATFCHNISRGIDIKIDSPNKVLNLIYIDNLIEKFESLLNSKEEIESNENYYTLERTYKISLFELAEKIYSYKSSRESLLIEKVGNGLDRALYSTYISYLDKKDFSYFLKNYSDKRGDFVEILKTKDSGQFSYFTAKTGITRGGHYHDTKTEKFLVVSGTARFKFFNLSNHESFELITNGNKPEIVESIPGWAHNITCISNEDLIVFLWANELFDKKKPDTFFHECK